MDWGTLVLNLVVSIVATVFLYLLVPLIIILTKKKYKAKTLKRINIINCIVVWIIFRVIQTALTGEPGAGVAVFLWGAVGHSLLKKHCLKEETIDDPSPQPASISTPNPLPTKTNLTDKPFKKYCSRCGNGIDPATKKCSGCGKQYFKGISFKTFLVIMLCILLFLSLALNILLCFIIADLRENSVTLTRENSTLRSEKDQLNTTNTTLNSTISKYKKEIDFYNKYVVLVADDGTDLYHHYNCYYFQACDSFWIYYVKEAEDKGFSPCPDCCK